MTRQPTFLHALILPNARIPRIPFSCKFSVEVKAQYFSDTKIICRSLVCYVTPPPANRLFPEIFLFFIVPHKKRVFPGFSLQASSQQIF